LTFDDGRELVMCGLTNWCKENGYSKGCLGRVAKRKEGRKKHKDIVAVEELAHPPTQEAQNTL